MQEKISSKHLSYAQKIYSFGRVNIRKGKRYMDFKMYGLHKLFKFIQLLPFSVFVPNP